MSEASERLRRVEHALRRLGEEHAPPAGWEARVLAATEREAPPRARRWWWMIVPLAALALIVAVWLARRAPHAALPLAITVEYTQAPTRYLADGANVGDVAHVVARGGDALWIYRNDGLILACPGQPPCRAHDGAPAADVTLSSIGTYRWVAVSGEVPAPTGVLDRDLAVLQRAGATTRVEIVVVR